MPHDKQGNELKVGDKVTLIAEVTELFGGDSADGDCNSNIRVEGPEASYRPSLTIGTRLLEKLVVILMAFCFFDIGQQVLGQDITTVYPVQRDCECCDTCKCPDGVCMCKDGKCSEFCEGNWVGASTTIPVGSILSGSSKQTFDLTEGSREGAVTDPVKATFRVQCKEGGGVSSFGTATAISPKWLVTNAHVIGRAASEDLNRTSIQGHGVQVTVQVLFCDTRSDIALLKIPDAAQVELPFVNIDAAGLQQGVPCQIYGYGSGELAGGTGNVGRPWGIRDIETGVPVWNTTLQVRQGDSGSGVFDQDGELIGVNWGNEPQGGSSFTPASYVLQAVDVWEKQYCVNGRCPRILGGRPLTNTQFQPVQPLPPNYQPPTYTPSAPSKVEVDMDALAAKVIERMKQDPDTWRGPKGDNGVDGKDGADGADAQTPEIDYTLLVSKLEEQLKQNPITVEFQGRGGEVTSTQTVQLGGTLTIPPVRLELQYGEDKEELQEVPVGGILAIQTQEEDRKKPTTQPKQ